MFSLSINPVVTRDKLIPDFIKAAQNRRFKPEVNGGGN